MNESFPRPQWWRLGPANLLVIALFTGLLATAATPITDPDLWWHLATGRYIVETHSIPHKDVFSYTAPDHKWITHEWLAGMGMIGLYRHGGQAALILATSIIITLSFTILYVQCTARPHLAVFAVLFGALASAITWGPRPQILSMLFTAILLYLLYQLRQKKRPVWWAFPMLVVVWVNLHGGYFFAFVVIGTVLVCDVLAHLLDCRTSATLDLHELRKLALVLGICIVVAGLNPNGFRILWYPFETIGSQAIRKYVQEWAPPAFNRPAYWPTVALFFAGVVAFILSRRKRDLSDLALFLGLFLMALLAGRHIPLFALVAAPIISNYGAQIELGRLRWNLSAPYLPRPMPNVLVFVNWLLVLVFVTVGAFRISKVLVENQNINPARFPVHAVEFIQRQGLIKQRIFNSYDWGGYLIWQGFKVFIDGRCDLYGDFLDQYALAYLVQNDWRVPLDQFSVDYILIERQAPLAILLRESGDWQQLYRDDLAIIFIRK